MTTAMDTSTVTVTIMGTDTDTDTDMGTDTDTDTGRRTVMDMARRMRIALPFRMQSQAWMPTPGRMREKLNSALPPAMPPMDKF